jgi:hypothetical protein
MSSQQVVDFIHKRLKTVSNNCFSKKNLDLSAKREAQFWLCYTLNVFIIY